MKRILDVKYGLAAFVSLVTFGVYLKSLHNEFFWDDFQYVVDNHHIRSFDLNFLKWAFLDFYAANWHPLTWISHALDYGIWGLDPLGHHLTNNILHAINTFFVVVLVVRLLANRQVGKLTSFHYSHFIAAGVTGLLFGLHPIHVESVAWVAERKDLLCALFYLLSIMAYVKYASNTSHRTQSTEQRAIPPMRYAPGPLLSALCFFILALLSKPMAVSLPFVLLILDWYPIRRVNSLKTFGAALIEKIPFMVLSLVSSVLTILAQRSGGALISIESTPLEARLLVAAASLTLYLRNMIVPIHLTPLYPYPRDISPVSSEYLLPIILVSGITLACVAAAKKWKLWPAVWTYYVITLLPVLGVVRIGSQSMADRYTYLPAIGPFLIAGLATAWVYRRSTFRKAIFAAAIAFVCVSMTYLTLKQIGRWEQNIGLWNYAIEREPTRATLAYYVRGLTLEKMYRLEEALSDYTTVIALEPFHLQVYYSRGRVFEKMGLLDVAMEDYGAIIAADPSSYEAYNCRGILYSRTGSLKKAIEDFNKAITINPGFAQAHNNRGITYSLLDQDDKALKDYNWAIELGQNYSDAYLNRGKLYLKKGNQEYAVSDFQKACVLGREEGCNAVAALQAMHK